MARPICKEQGCEREINGHGLCKPHYMHWYRTEKARNGNKNLTDKADRIKPEPGGRLPRMREWDEEDLDAFWLWIKRELKIA